MSSRSFRHWTWRLYHRAIEREPELEPLIPMAVASANDERGAKERTIRAIGGGAVNSMNA
jgi:hypothetical protein